MTVIAARVQPGYGVIAADTAATAYTVADCGPKLLRISPHIVIGMSGSMLLNRWARRELRSQLSPLPPIIDSHHLLTKLEDAWDEYHRWCRDRGHGRDEGGDVVMSSEALIVIPGQIYQLEGDGSVVRFREDFAAIGSGGAVAVGAMECGVSARRAVEASIRRAPGCGGDVEVLEVPR